MKRCLVMLVAGCASARQPATAPQPAAAPRPPPHWIELAPLPAGASYGAVVDWGWRCAASIATARAWIMERVVDARSHRDVIQYRCHRDQLTQFRAVEPVLEKLLSDAPGPTDDAAAYAKAYTAACDWVKAVVVEAEHCGSSQIVTTPPACACDATDLACWAGCLREATWRLHARRALLEETVLAGR